MRRFVEHYVYQEIERAAKIIAPMTENFGVDPAMIVCHLVLHPEKLPL